MRAGFLPPSGHNLVRYKHANPAPAPYRWRKAPSGEEIMADTRDVNEEDGEVGEELVRELKEPLDRAFGSRFGEERTSAV